MRNTKFRAQVFLPGLQLRDLAPNVRRLDNAIHRINCYLVDRCQQNKPRYPLGSDLSGG